MHLLKLTATKVRVKLSIIIYSECVWRIEAVFATVDKCILRSFPSFYQICPFPSQGKSPGRQSWWQVSRLNDSLTICACSLDGSFSSAQYPQWMFDHMHFLLPRTQLHHQFYYLDVVCKGSDVMETAQTFMNYNFSHMFIP